jgi:hypothetical protein
MDHKSYREQVYVAVGLAHNLSNLSGPLQIGDSPNLGTLGLSVWGRRVRVREKVTLREWCV